MRKFLTAGLAALTLGGSALATTTPAAAEPRGDWGRGDWHGDRGWRGDRGDDVGIALVAGVIGLGLGAALSQPHYNNGPRYYDEGYNYGPRYGACFANEQVWDPYYGRYVIERVRYAC